MSPSNRPHLLLLFLALSAMWPATPCAQTAPWYVEKADLGKGRMDQIVYDVIQNRQGFIWLGTPSGLVRYDGYQPRTFLMQPDDRPFLRANRVNQVLEDHSGSIWYLIGNETDSWIRIFDPLTERHRTVFLEGNPAISYSNARFNDVMIADAGGPVWIRSEHGLYRIAGEAGSEGTMTYQGDFTSDLATMTVSGTTLITGGTGAFKGARGNATITSGTITGAFENPPFAVQSRLIGSGSLTYRK